MIYTYEYETAYHGPALPMVEIEADVILGRDVLNQMIVTLNGLANVVELSE